MNNNWQKRISCRLFVLALALSVLTSFYLPSYSQTPIPTPSEEALIEDIQEYVSIQLESGNPPIRDKEIEQLYLEAAEVAGVSYKELILLYKIEYAKQKTVQQSSPWEQFEPYAGWLVGLASLLALAYVRLTKRVDRNAA